MEETCVELGLPICNLCRIRQGARILSKNGECWVRFYGYEINKNLKKYIVHKLRYPSVYPVYFVAALKYYNPALLEVYEKLIILK
jgi:hypothetical protein